MRLVDLDKLGMPGKTQILKQLDKWEKEHPITEIVVSETDDYNIILEKKEKKACRKS